MSRDDCPSTGRHGDRAAYNHDRCRCPDASADAVRYQKQWRLRHLEGRPPQVDSTGTVRRVRALAAAGWAYTAIAREAGVSAYTLPDAADHPTVRRVTAERVRRAYDTLAGQPGPNLRVTAVAKGYGWVPPAGWAGVDMDDPAALPWPRTLPDGSVEQTVKPCGRGRCAGYMPLAGPHRTYCSPRCSRAARRDTWAARDAARTAAKAA